MHSKHFLILCWNDYTFSLFIFLLKMENISQNPVTQGFTIFLLSLVHVYVGDSLVLLLTRAVNEAIMWLYSLECCLLSRTVCSQFKPVCICVFVYEREGGGRGEGREREREECLHKSILPQQKNLPPSSCSYH